MLPTISECADKCRKDGECWAFSVYIPEKDCYFYTQEGVKDGKVTTGKNNGVQHLVS